MKQGHLRMKKGRLPGRIRAAMNVIIPVALQLLLSGAMLMAQQERIPVVPYPQQVTAGQGTYQPGGSAVSLRISGLDEVTGQLVTEQLDEAFQNRYGRGVIAGDKDNPDIWIGLPAADGELLSLVRREGIEPDQGLGEEGYILVTGRKRILVVANGGAGAFYGVQSLKQLLRGTPPPLEVPVLVIRDWPAISFRCVMDDISRGPVPTHDFIKQQIRRYAEMKINHMSFYIEHVVKTEAYPDFAPNDGAISIGEFRELSDYAAGYHIKLVGNFQSLGHFEKILSHPQYRHLGATDRMLDPLNPESMEFLGNVYREMAPAFSSAYFTPNCDEAWDLSRGGLTGAADSIGVARIYADHVMRIDSILRQLGKRTIIWGDIILEHPEILEMIPKSMVVGAWDYSASESFARFIDPVKRAGFDFTISPGILNSGRLIPDFRMTTANIRNFINEGYEKGTLGVYCTVWDDGGMHFFSRDWYGVAYNAEQCWRPSRDPLEDFDRRFSRGIYGDPEQLVPRTLHALNRLTDLGPTFEMNYGVFTRTLVPERGDKLTFDPDSWSGIGKWVDEAEAVLGSAETPCYGSDLDFIRFTIAQYDFMCDARKDLLEAADAYARASALQSGDRPASLETLKTALDLADGVRERYENLAGWFAELWDMENRAYWRDRALLEYRRQLGAMADQGVLLRKAIGDFEAGSYLPPPAEVRLDIRRLSGQYFQYWLLAGSFPLGSFEESDRDFLGSMGGQEQARPFPGMRFTAGDGKEYSWIKYDSPVQGEVDLAEIFDPPIRAVAYAYCTIDSPEKRRVTALLGSNDGATVWCNGKEVHRVHVKRSLIPDEDEIQLDLEQGRNHILVRVEQWKGDWGFSFRLRDADVRNHKQKYEIR